MSDSRTRGRLSYVDSYLTVTEDGRIGGGTRKYYQSTTRGFSYDLPASSGDRFASAQKTTSEELAVLIKTLIEKLRSILRQ